MVGETTARENGHTRRVRLTRDCILDAATEVFGQDGYRAATIEQIAVRAEVAASSVYNHFVSKAGVAQALAERALDVHQRYVAAAWSRDVSPLGRLIAAAGATLAFAREHPILCQAISLSYLGPLGLFPPETAAAGAIATRREEQFKRITETLEAAVAAGELRVLDAPATARYLVASWAGVLAMDNEPGTDPATALSAGIWAMIEGMACPSTLTGAGRIRAQYRQALERCGLAAPRI